MPRESRRQGLLTRGIPTVHCDGLSAKTLLAVGRMISTGDTAPLPRARQGRTPGRVLLVHPGTGGKPSTPGRHEMTPGRGLNRPLQAPGAPNQLPVPPCVAGMGMRTP